MAGTTLEQRMVLYKKTQVYQKLISGEFSFLTALIVLTRESHNPKTTWDIKTETRMASEVYYAMMFHKGFLDTARRRRMFLDFRRDVIARMVEKNGLDPSEQTLKRFYRTLTACRLAHTACTRFKFKTPPVELSEKEVVLLLKTKKSHRIIYDCGINVVTPNEGYGGVICGFMRQEVVDSLRRKDVITQDVYFNCDGRKSYSLYYPGKTNELPSWLRGSNLPPSYLRACGVR